MSSGDQRSIEHHGIKGQRWGVRRSNSELARLGGRKKEEAGETVDEKLDNRYMPKEYGIGMRRDAKRAREAIYKDRRNLSDERLLAYGARVEREKKLRDLIDEDMHAGRTAVKKGVLSGSEKAVSKTVEAAGTLIGKKMLSTVFSEADVNAFYKVNDKGKKKTRADIRKAVKDQQYEKNYKVKLEKAEARRAEAQERRAKKRKKMKKRAMKRAKSALSKTP